MVTHNYYTEIKDHIFISPPKHVFDIKYMPFFWKQFFSCPDCLYSKNGDREITGCGFNPHLGHCDVSWSKILNYPHCLVTLETHDQSLKCGEELRKPVYVLVVINLSTSI